MEEFKVLLIQQLEELNDAGKQWREAVPGFAAAAHAPELRQAIEAEGARDRADTERLNRAFKALGAPNHFRASKGMGGLIEETRDAIRDARRLPKPAADAALSIGIRKIKHYEICAYDCARKLGIRIENSDVAALMAEIMHEECEFDKYISNPTPTAEKAA